MPNIIDMAIDAVKRDHWRRWLHNLDDQVLQQVHANFVKWRDNPGCDFRLSHDELCRRVAIIEKIIASRR